MRLVQFSNGYQLLFSSFKTNPTNGYMNLVYLLICFRIFRKSQAYQYRLVRKRNSSINVNDAWFKNILCIWSLFSYSIVWHCVTKCNSTILRQSEMANFEEMDTINPVMDLVVFRPIKDIDMGMMKSLPVSYDLGLNFHPHLNDWVGLFYSGWESVNDFLEYRWAPMLPRDLNAAHKRRRSVLFDVSNFAVRFNKWIWYCYYHYSNNIIIMMIL